MDMDPEHISESPFVAGAIGALITAVRFTPGATWAERAVNVLSGSTVAGFVAPALAEWLHLSPVYLSAASFVLGLVGMSLVAASLQAIKDTPLGQIVTGWISRR